jgi:hypothetical protein
MRYRAAIDIDVVRRSRTPVVSPLTAVMTRRALTSASGNRDVVTRRGLIRDPLKIASPDWHDLLHRNIDVIDHGPSDRDWHRSGFIDTGEMNRRLGNEEGIYLKMNLYTAPRSALLTTFPFTGEPLDPIRDVAHQ